MLCDSDIRQRVLAGGLDPETPVFRVMSAPVLAVSDGALVYEALQIMRERGIRHLAVKDDGGRVLGVIGQSDLFQFHQYSPAVWCRRSVGPPRPRNSPKCTGACRSVRTLIDCGACPRA
jgi:CBS domain-containing protein